MIEFLTVNWKLIAIIGAILVELVILLVFKKRPQIIDDSFFKNVCTWIEQAESLYVVGKDKMSFVLNKAAAYLGSNYNEGAVRAIVEWLLTLPEKKGEKNEK